MRHICVECVAIVCMLCCLFDVFNLCMSIFMYSTIYIVRICLDMSIYKHGEMHGVSQ